MIHVNWTEVTGGGIVLSLAVLTYLGFCVLETTRIRHAEREDRKKFEQDMKDAPLSPWNGETYDWTPEQLRGMSDTAVYAGPGVADTASFPAVPDPWAASADPGWAQTGPFPPVPASTISGPLPVQPEPYEEFDADAAAEAFLKKMHDDNEAFLAGLGDL